MSFDNYPVFYSNCNDEETVFHKYNRALLLFHSNLKYSEHLLRNSSIEFYTFVSQKKKKTS
jgi:hypothetical protein